MTEHPNLASALVAALAELTIVDKGRTAKAGAYSYDYADIADVIKDTRPVLAEHGVVALTPLSAHDDELAVTVILLHTSGDRMDLGPFPFPHGKDAQATGSMVTYHRRYALLAALGMAAGDDDGAAAVPRQGEKPEPARVAIPAALAARLDALPKDAQERLGAWAARSGEPNIRSVPEAWVVAIERAVIAEEKKAAPSEESAVAALTDAGLVAETHPLEAKARSVASKARA